MTEPKPIAGTDVRALRDRLDENQTAFAQRFGVDQTTISRWEIQGLPASGAARVLFDRLSRDAMSDEAAA